MNLKGLHKKQIGSIGEITIARDLMLQGYPVFFELGDLSRTDLIALIDGRAIKIQVKVRHPQRRNSDVVAMELKKSGPNYSYKYNANDVDIFALYVPDYGIGYFSSKFCNSHSALIIRLKNKPKHKSCRMLEDFASIRKALEF